MERLTEWDEFGNADIIALSDMMPEIYAELSFDETNALTEALNRLAAYEDAMPLERSQELAQAEKDGRLVVLPCKAWDKVWIDGRKAIVEEFFGYETERYLHAQFYDNMQYIDIPFDEIGKTVFLTREEAEAALKKREEADHEAD